MVVAAAVAIAATWALLPSSRTVGGFSALYTGHPALMVGAIVVWGAIVGAIGAVCGATGNPVAGPAVIGVALLATAVGSGSIDGWVRRVGSPGSYGVLAVELAIWAGVIGAAAAAGIAARRRLRRGMPSLVRHGHYHESAELEERPPTGAASVLAPILIAGAVVFALERPMVTDFAACLLVAMALHTVLWAAALGIDNLRRGRPVHRMGPSVTAGYLAGAASIAVGQAFVFVLMRSEAIGQVVGALIVGMTIATMVGHQMFPTARRLPLLMSPFLIGAAGYIWTAGSVGGEAELLGRFFTHFSSAFEAPLPQPARALPVHYASAGLFGAALGIGWSQGFHAASQKHVSVVGA